MVTKSVINDNSLKSKGFDVYNISTYIAGTDYSRFLRVLARCILDLKRLKKNVALISKIWK